jgi:hypothetical protein
VNIGCQPAPSSHFGIRPLPAPHIPPRPRTLCSLCVSALSWSSFFSRSPLLATNFPSEPPGALSFSFSRRSSRIANIHRIRTYEKYYCNPFVIRTFKTQDLKPFRIRSYEKTPTGVGIHSFRPAQPLPLFSTSSKHATHSNRRNSIPLMALLHGSLNTGGGGTPVQPIKSRSLRNDR